MRVIDMAIKEHSGAAMSCREQIELTPEAGIDGDYHRRGKRQVTILFREDWEAACQELGVALPWTTRRANILAEGTSLPESQGTVVTIGNCTLEITGETAPCSLMEASQAGLRAALGVAWRGGVTCKVVSAGRIAVGDSVDIKSAQPSAAD